MEIINLLMAGLTTLTAFFVAYIAWQQHGLGQRQFRHDLYDRRFKVFLATRSFLSEVARDASVRPGRCLQFLAETAEAEFLFKEDIVKLIGELYQKGVKLAVFHEKLYPESGQPGFPVGDERNQVAHEESQVLKEMMDALPSLKTAFKPYLGVE